MIQDSLYVKNPDTVFDFDFWMKLARTNPEAFEQKRRQTLRRVIDQAPKSTRQRLEGVQWRIDMELRRSKNPLDGCLRVYRMMLDSLYGKNGFFDAIQRLKTQATIQINGASKTSTVIDFPGDRH